VAHGAHGRGGHRDESNPGKQNSKKINTVPVTRTSLAGYSGSAAKTEMDGPHSDRKVIVHFIGKIKRKIN
jgi:hypothetical protein